MKTFDVIVKGGTVVTASDTFKSDIGIKNGKIVEMGLDLGTEAEQILDATGKYVFPGGIDPHTHMDMPFGGTYSSDDFETGTKAAACGGTTTIVDFAIQPNGKKLKDAVDTWHKKADGKAAIDYGFHISVTDLNDDVLNEMPEIIKQGYSSFKMFMTYDGLRVDDGTIIRTLIKVNESGGLACVHAENYYVIDYFTKKFREEGKGEPIYHALSRPDLAEGEAAGRAIKLAKIANAPLCIVHNSCEASVSEIARARAEGYPIIGETCPQYLLLSEDNYREPDFNGAKYVMSPPLRDKKNWPSIWKALKDNTVQFVATDHCPFFMKQKEMGKEFFAQIPNGAPGVELRMSLMYTYGVVEGKIDLNRFVQVISTNAAKVYGMYPQKGTIAVGSDADIVIFDPNVEVTATKSMLHENVDYTPYEGFKLKGYPVVTVSRGEVVAKDGKYVGKEGRGQFIKRGAPKLI